MSELVLDSTIKTEHCFNWWDLYNGFMSNTFPNTPVDVWLEPNTADYPFRDSFDTRRLPFYKILGLHIPKTYSPPIQDELIKGIFESKVLKDLEMSQMLLPPIKLLVSSQVSRCLKILQLNIIILSFSDKRRMFPGGKTL